MPKPDLYVYLHADVEQLLNNIHKRGRDYEQDMAPAYLEKIRKGYFNFFKQVENFPVLIIDTNNIDFVQNHDDYHQLKNVIFNSDYKLGINRVIF